MPTEHKVKIGDKELTISKIKGEKAIELLALGGVEENVSKIIKKTIAYGSNANLEDLEFKEIIQLVDEINNYNGFTEDFTAALGKKSSGE